MDMSNKLQTLIQTPTVLNTGALARIHLAAFKEDRCVRLMYDEGAHWRAVDAMVETRYSHVNYGMKVAVTKGEHRIAGWLCCSLVDSDTPAQDDMASLEWTTAAIRVVEDMEERLTKSSGRPHDVAEGVCRRRIWKAILDASTEAFSRSAGIMAQAKYIVINTVVTDTICQRRGVGFELLSWATNYADNEGIPIWAQVPTTADRLFRKAGFEEVYSLVLDLDDYYDGGVAKEHRGKPKWGSHELKYMIRKAKGRSVVDQPK